MDIKVEKYEHLERNGAKRMLCCKGRAVGVDWLVVATL